MASFAKSKKINVKIIDAVIDINKTQPQRVLGLLKNSLGSLRGKTIAVLGLAFKPDTDDMRESPSVALITELKNAGAHVRVTDPKTYNANKKFIDNLGVRFESTISSVLKQVDAAVVMTAWGEYKKISPRIFKEYMKNPVLVDSRRIYKKSLMEKEGIIYNGIGLSGGI